MRRRSRYFATAIAVIGAVTLTACSGGSSDTVGDAVGSGDGSAGTLNLFAYAVPKAGFDKIIPAFTATDAGKNLEIQDSYGASGDQSRKVRDGAEADIVNFSVEPDISRLVAAGLVDENWNADANKGIPFGSVVTVVVREGNPKNIRTWDDLLRPDVEVVTPNPFSSGSAKWNLLAPYADKSDGGKNPQAGLDYLNNLVGQHVKVQPASAREATETFLQGRGDALLSYENEALFIERNGESVEHVTPATTFKIDNPVAVIKNSQNLEKATAFKDYLFTPEGQTLWAEAGFRPVDPEVGRTFAGDFPAPEKLWTIADLGGWTQVDNDLFAQDTGSVAKIYDAATK